MIFPLFSRPPFYKLGCLVTIIGALVACKLELEANIPLKSVWEEAYTENSADILRIYDGIYSLEKDLSFPVSVPTAANTPSNTRWMLDFYHKETQNDFMPADVNVTKYNMVMVSSAEELYLPPRYGQRKQASDFSLGNLQIRFFGELSSQTEFLSQLISRKESGNWAQAKLKKPSGKGTMLFKTEKTRLLSKLNASVEKLKGVKYALVSEDIYYMPAKVLDSKTFASCILVTKTQIFDIDSGELVAKKTVLSESAASQKMPMGSSTATGTKSMASTMARMGMGMGFAPQKIQAIDKAFSLNRPHSKKRAP